MKRIFVISAVIAAIAIPSAVLASKHSDKLGGDRVQKMFEKHDANKDGVLDKNEMPERFQKHFEKADKDGNGSLTMEEANLAHAERREKHMTKMMMRFDTDSDGLISKDEVMAFVTEKFEKVDANGDGKLSTEELAKMGPMMRRGGHHGHKDKG